MKPIRPALLSCFALVTLITAPAHGSLVYQLEETFEEPELRRPLWIVERGDFELGNVTIQSEVVRNGERAVRLINKATDPLPATERTEMVPSRAGNLEWGQEYWVGFSFYLENWVTAKEPEMVHQLHAVPGNYNWKVPSGRNATCLRIENGIMEFQVITKPVDGPASGGATAIPVWSEPVQSDVWQDWVLHLRLSSQEDGLIEAWRNGELIYRQEGPNVDPIDGSGGPAFPRHYLKVGTYNWHWVRYKPEIGERVIYYDEIRIGHVEGGYTGGREGVDPENFSPRPQGAK